MSVPTWRKPSFGSVQVSTVAAALPAASCKRIKLQNRAVNDDLSVNDKNIYYGNATVQPYELIPGEETDWIPAGDASDLFVKTLAGTCTMAFKTSQEEL
jgi:K+/H+ antiporter YhaU regulatory subunit KhtT